MRVSVIVPVFNAEDTLGACLDALLRQDLPCEQYEVIVVDNGSTDGTWAVIESYGRRVRSLREDIPSSYAARNTAVRTSRGDLLAFTDADCIPDPNWLGELILGFRDSAVGCVGGDILPVAAVTSAERYALRRGTLNQRNTLRHPYRPFFATANVAFRRQVFEQIGLFEQSLESGGDVDFCWRMQEQTSWKLHFQESAKLLHHHRIDWRGLWGQYERYGRGRASLQVLYPNFPANPYDSPVESVRRLLRLARHGAKYAIRRSMSPRTQDVSREDLEFAFYSLLTQAAFATGKRRGPKRPVSRTVQVTQVALTGG